MQLVTKEELMSEIQKSEERCMKKIALIEAKMALLEKQLNLSEKVYSELQNEMAELRGDMVVVIATYKRKQLLHAKN